jgi:hypothetical protein
MTDPGGAIFSGVGFWATDMPSGGARPAGGQGFAMSSSEMRAMLQKATDQRNSISNELVKASRLSQAEPPADEPVSNAAVYGVNGINETGRYYEGHLRYQYNYYTELITRLKQALGITEATDQTAADAAKKVGGSFG